MSLIGLVLKLERNGVISDHERVQHGNQKFVRVELSEREGAYDTLLQSLENPIRIDYQRSEGDTYYLEDPEERVPGFVKSR